MPNFFKEGAKHSLPVCISFLLIFFSIGVIYKENGFTFFESVLSTGLIFAGPLQVASLSSVVASDILAAIILTLLINFRFFLMSLVLSQYFNDIPRRYILLSMLGMSASTYAVTQTYLISSSIDGQAQFKFFLGVSIPSFLTALLATLLGYELATILSYGLFTSYLVMLIPVHFTSLAAKRSGKDLSVLATVAGGVFTPFLNSINISLLGILMAITFGFIVGLIDRNIRVR